MPIFELRNLGFRVSISYTEISYTASGVYGEGTFNKAGVERWDLTGEVLVSDGLFGAVLGRFRPPRRHSCIRHVQLST